MTEPQHINVNIFLENYYDFQSSNYYHIITLSKIPNGPLKNYVKHISIKNVSTKINRANENYCSFVIDSNILNTTNTTHINNKLNICTIENITDIYDFIVQLLFFK